MFFVDKTSLELVFLKQKELKNKSLLKKKFHVGGGNIYSRISFVLACKALMSFFLNCELFRCVCVQQNVIFFSFKEKSEIYSAKLQRYFLPSAPVCFLWEVIW